MPCKEDAVAQDLLFWQKNKQKKRPVSFGTGSSSAFPPPLSVAVSCTAAFPSSPLPVKGGRIGWSAVEEEVDGEPEWDREGDGERQLAFWMQQCADWEDPSCILEEEEDDDDDDDDGGFGPPTMAAALPIPPHTDPCSPPRHTSERDGTKGKTDGFLGGPAERTTTEAKAAMGWSCSTQPPPQQQRHRPRRLQATISPGAGSSTAVVGMSAETGKVIRVPVERRAHGIWWEGQGGEAIRLRRPSRLSDPKEGGGWRHSGDGSGIFPPSPPLGMSTRSEVVAREAPALLLAIGPTLYVAEGGRRSETEGPRPRWCSRSVAGVWRDDANSSYRRGEAGRPPLSPFPPPPPPFPFLEAIEGSRCGVPPGEETPAAAAAAQDVAVVFAYIERLEAAGEITATSDVPSLWTYLLDQKKKRKDGERAEEEEGHRQLVLSLLGWDRPAPLALVSETSASLDGSNANEGPAAARQTSNGEPKRVPHASPFPGNEGNLMKAAAKPPPPPSPSASLPPPEMGSSGQWRERDVAVAALYGDFEGVLSYLAPYPTSPAPPSSFLSSPPSHSPWIAMVRHFVQHRHQLVRVLVESNAPTRRAFLHQFPMWLLLCLFACCNYPPRSSRSASISPWKANSNLATQEEEGEEEEETVAMAELWASATDKTWPYRLEWIYQNPRISCWDRLAIALLLERQPRIFSSSSSSSWAGPRFHTEEETAYEADETEEEEGFDAPFVSPPHRLPFLLHYWYQHSSALQALMIGHGIRESSVTWVQMMVDETGDYLLGACLLARVGVRGVVEEEEEMEEAEAERRRKRYSWDRWKRMEENGEEATRTMHPHGFSLPPPRSLPPHRDCFHTPPRMEDFYTPRSKSNGERRSKEEERMMRLARWRERVRNEAEMEVYESAFSSSYSSLSGASSLSQVTTTIQRNPEDEEEEGRRGKTEAAPLIARRRAARRTPKPDEETESEAKRNAKVKTTSPLARPCLPLDRTFDQKERKKRGGHGAIPTTTTTTTMAVSPPLPHRSMRAAHSEMWLWWLDAHRTALQSEQSFIEGAECVLACRQLRAAYVSSSSAAGASRVSPYPGRNPPPAPPLPIAPQQTRTSWGGLPPDRRCAVCQEPVEACRSEPAKQKDAKKGGRRRKDMERKRVWKGGHPSRSEDSLARASSSSSSSSSSDHVLPFPLRLQHAWVWCATCGHGGHLHHLRGWFDTHRVCPTEHCTCCCNEG